MPSLPSISIVTPSLNQGRFIRSTIDSVLSQRYEPLEYRVQDGRSADGTISILESCKDLVPFESTPDHGQSDAINRGLRRATGNVLGYLNSDDVLLPGCLHAVGRAFADDPDLLFVFGAAVLIDEEGRTLRPYPTRPDAFEQLEHACFIAQPAAFFRRQVWEELGGFDEGLHHALDYDYWLRLRARYGAARTRYLDTPLAGARVHADAKTIAAWGRALDEIFTVVQRRTGHLSAWWCLSKWDHLMDGRPQTMQPHRLPWRAFPPALLEFLVRNRPGYWWPGLGRPTVRRLRERLGRTRAETRRDPLDP